MQHRPSPPRPRTAYWWCQVGGWGVYCIINFLASAGFLAPSWRTASGYLFFSVVGLFLSHRYRQFLLRRRWLDLPVAKLIPRAIGVALLLAVITVGLVTIWFTFLPPPGSFYPSRSPAQLAAIWTVFVFNDFIIFTLWSGIYFGFAYFQKQRRDEIERYQAQTALAEAELRGLKSQLNPHFLFNSLNSLRALVLEDPGRAQEAITQLAAILRYHLQSGERSLVPLGDELEMVEQYLALELVRFEDRLTIERQIDRSALLCLVPPLALQSLVENAIKYGISRETGAGVVRLNVAQADGLLDIAVRNRGSLRPPVSADTTGLGLTNLQTRLHLLFDGRAHFRLHESAPGWVEARIVLPAMPK